MKSIVREIFLMDLLDSFFTQYADLMFVTELLTAAPSKFVPLKALCVSEIVVGHEGSGA